MRSTPLPQKVFLCSTCSKLSALKISFCIFHVAGNARIKRDTGNNSLQEAKVWDLTEVCLELSTSGANRLWTQQKQCESACTMFVALQKVGQGEKQFWTPGSSRASLGLYHWRMHYGSPWGPNQKLELLKNRKTRLLYIFTPHVKLKEKKAYIYKCLLELEGPAVSAPSTALFWTEMSEVFPGKA